MPGVDTSSNRTTTDVEIRPLIRTVAAATAVAASVMLAAAPAAAGTTVTRYQYNADGALTAVTTQVDDGDASTAYLTWDDFVPDEDDPTTGTIYAGNGNLLAIGPKPGSGSSLFAFDNRDRLTSFSGADKSAAYGYHADGLMASSTAADDSGFGFYYAGSDMSNLHQTDTGQWSARLGAVRYLDDGSEEVLLTPRKDVAATYDPSSNTVKSYDYDSFGAGGGRGSLLRLRVEGQSAPLRRRIPRPLMGRLLSSGALVRPGSWHLPVA